MRQKYRESNFISPNEEFAISNLPSEEIVNSYLPRKEIAFFYFQREELVILTSLVKMGILQVGLSTFLGLCLHGDYHPASWLSIAECCTAELNLSGTADTDAVAAETADFAAENQGYIISYYDIIYLFPLRKCRLVVIYVISLIIGLVH